jgi:hypothetical protein
MKQNLLFIKEGFDSFDADPQKTMYFYNNPSAKIKLFQELCQLSAMRIEGICNPLDNNTRSVEIYEWLNTHFHKFTWSAHDVHFHTNFSEYLSCPYTCLNEISTCLDKLMVEFFHA